MYLVLAKFGVDSAENEPHKVLLIIQPWDSIFTEPPRPSVEQLHDTSKLVRSLCLRSTDLMETVPFFSTVSMSFFFRIAFRN